MEESPSEIVTEMVRRLLTENEDYSFTSKEFVPGYDGGERKRSEVKLTKSEA